MLCVICGPTKAKRAASKTSDDAKATRKTSSEKKNRKPATIITFPVERTLRTGTTE